MPNRNHRQIGSPMQPAVANAVVVAPDVDAPDLAETHLHHVITRLKPEASASDLIWALSELFPAR